jgi:hypothetical protein
MTGMDEGWEYMRRRLNSLEFFASGPLAESGSVDRPALTPIGFGIDRIRNKEDSKK